MTHVKITGDAIRSSVLVDGFDLGRHVLPELKIDYSPVEDDRFGGEGYGPRVTVTIVADSLEVDLPEAIVVAMREGRS